MSQNIKNDNISDQPPWRPEYPYNEILGLPPRADVENKVILRQCVTARAALAELKQAAGLIPNPAMLINTLPLLEAQASSEIENIVTTADQLFRHLDAESAADPATREALRYRWALLEGVEALATRPLVTGTAEMICSRIKGVTMSVRRLPGTRIVNAANGEVIYTPPEGEALIRDLMADWERYLHGSAPPDPLIRMAITHYQFEAIHPFTDGNGRTGRVLNSLYLVEQGLLHQPILYLSRYIISNRADYYRLLLAVTREEAWEEWILYILRGVEDTALWTVDKIAAIRRLSAETAAHVRQALPKIYSRELIDVIFEQPYCRIGHIVERGIAGRQAASRYLKALAAIGILEEQAVGRDKLFVHPRLLGVLTTNRNDYPGFTTPG
jgi:Fic family protein